MTILDFIAVASFGLTSFGLGFALGLAIKSSRPAPNCAAT